MKHKISAIAQEANPLEAKKEAKLNQEATQITEEKECHEVNGKLECAGKKIKNKIKNMVE